MAQNKPQSKLFDASSSRTAPVEWIEFKCMFNDQKDTLEHHRQKLGLPEKATKCLVWFPYERFQHVKLLGKGSFAIVYKADIVPRIQFGTEELSSFALKEVSSSKEVIA